MLWAQDRYHRLGQITLSSPGVEEATIRMVPIRCGVLRHYRRDDLRWRVVNVGSPWIDHLVLLSSVAAICLLHLRTHLGMRRLSQSEEVTVALARSPVGRARLFGCIGDRILRTAKRDTLRERTTIGLSTARRAYTRLPLFFFGDAGKHLSERTPKRFRVTPLIQRALIYLRKPHRRLDWIRLLVVQVRGSRTTSGRWVFAHQLRRRRRLTRLPPPTPGVDRGEHSR